MNFNFGWIPQIQQELRRYFATVAQGALADSSLQPANIGSVVQAYNANLAAIATLNTTGAIERTGVGTAATYPITAYGKSLVAAANASDGRGLLGVTIGSNVQAWNTNLDAIAGLGTTGVIERTGPGTYVTYPQLPTAKIADAAITTAKLAAAVQNNLLPPGAVIHVAGSAAPAGFIKANGATISRTTYASLFAAIGTTYGAGDGSTTFTLPDLRGEFLRGWDDGRGVDDSRALGSAQKGTLMVYDTLSAGIWTLSTTTTGGAISRSNVGADPITPADYPNTLQLTTTPSGSKAIAGDAESQPGATRPRNVALLACIKF